MTLDISEVVDMSELLEITDTAPLRTAQAQKVQRQLDKKHEEFYRRHTGKADEGRSFQIACRLHPFRSLHCPRHTGLGQERGGF